MATALICGIAGQDGAYLAQLLLQRGHRVVGTSRNVQAGDFANLDRLGIRDRVELATVANHDQRSVEQALARYQPDEVYHLAGQSSVGLSFHQPVETFESIALSTLHWLEALRTTRAGARFFSAGSGDCFGDTGEHAATESTPTRPCSPYAVAKAAAFWQVANYREAFGLYACTGILFNHESPLRPARFVTQKIVHAACSIAAGSPERLQLGNLDIRRDWGWAPEYVDAMWRMLQQDAPRDIIIATGETHSLQDFVAEAFKAVGLHWLDHVETDPALMRPTDIRVSRADPGLAAARLGWQARTRMHDVVRALIDAEQAGLPRKSEQKTSNPIVKRSYPAIEIKAAMTPSVPARIYVAGHRGMVGSAIVRQLIAQGHAPENIVSRTHAELELTDQAAVRAFLAAEKPDQVYMAAARVGGIHANNTYPAEFIYDNLMVEANLVHESFLAGVKKFLFLGSSCIYPRLAAQPMNEDALLTGKLEPTNEPYAVAKIAGIKLCESYNRQYGASHGLDYRSVMPTNLYGPGDNYHPDNSHVVPALIRRFHEAKVNQAPTVTIWGTGSPLREFLHVDDLAAACVFVMNLPKALYDQQTSPMQSHLNVGFGSDISIAELARCIARVVGYTGVIGFDVSKPDGTPRKLMDSSRLNALGWKPTVTLEQGLANAYADFIASHPPALAPQAGAGQPAFQ